MLLFVFGGVGVFCSSYCWRWPYLLVVVMAVAFGGGDGSN